MSEGTSTSMQDAYASNWKYFPRCEYKARFNGTSAFEMTDAKHWGTYFRSTKRGGNYDRLAEILKSEKTYTGETSQKPGKRTNRRSSSGMFKGPYCHHQYNLRSMGKIDNLLLYSQQSNANDTPLYGQLLRYKTKLCNIVVEAFNKIKHKHINIYVENDFPCIMVQVRSFKKKIGKSSLYKIAIAYFAALTNVIAYKNQIPIEMVLRASFGHNIPSLSSTAHSFRINIGIVPEIYAKDVLVRSLKILDNKIEQFLNEKLITDNDKIRRFNRSIDLYNQTRRKKPKTSKIVDKLTSEDSVFVVLCKRGDSKGNTFSRQLTRQNQNIDLLCGYVHNELMQNLENIDLTIEPLKKLFQKLRFKRNIVTMKVPNDDYNSNNFEFPKLENSQIAGDEEFWSIIKNVASKICLPKMCEQKKIHSLNEILEKANLKFIQNCNRQSVNGYGSDSDFEGSTRKFSSILHYFPSANDSESYKMKYHCKKVIVATGMRAISLAYSLAKCLIEKIDGKDTRQMYYETSDAIKNADDDINFTCDKFKQETIRFIDLNYCAIDFNRNSKVKLNEIQKQLIKNKEQVIVFDYTSATSAKLKRAVRLFIPHTKVLLLVSSGSKHEQIGADNNPYGTIRIVSTDSKILDQLYSGLIEALNSKNEKLPSDLHDIRKAYKSIGAILTNEQIFKDD